jgi:hypothetical protein
MGKGYAVLCAAALLLAGCTGTGHQAHPSSVTQASDTDRDLPAPPPDHWVSFGTGRARITGWSWVAPQPYGRQPAAGTWLVLDVEVQAQTAPVSVSLWQWTCLGAYDGVQRDAVATPLDGVWDVQVPPGVSAVGQVACDPDPGQAVVAQWRLPSSLDRLPSWLVPARD